MTIDTILLCFCEDCYQNDGTPEKNKVLHNVIASNAEHAAVSASIIYLNSKQEQREYDMLIKVDKWTLKDLKKAVENIGEHNKAPAMSDHEEVRVDDEFLSLSLSLLTSLPLPPSSYLSLTLSPLLLSVSLSRSPLPHTITGGAPHLGQEEEVVQDSREGKDQEARNPWNLQAPLSHLHAQQRCNRVAVS